MAGEGGETTLHEGTVANRAPAEAVIMQLENQPV